MPIGDLEENGFMPAADDEVAVADALDLLALAQEHCGETVSAFELINGMGLQFLAETMPDVRLPFDHIPEWMVLVDLGGARGQSASYMLEVLFADGFERGLGAGLKCRCGPCRRR